MSNISHLFIKGCEWVRGGDYGSGDAQHYQNILLAVAVLLAHQVRDAVGIVLDHMIVGGDENFLCVIFDDEAGAGGRTVIIF